jgi:hypothetical protein
MEKVLKALEAVPEGETQASIVKMTGLQARAVGPVLTALLGQKRVVCCQVRKRSGQGEKWYDAWRLASPTEILLAKVEEMRLAPTAEDGRAAGRQDERTGGDKGGQADEGDTDWLDEVAAAGAGQ